MNRPGLTINIKGELMNFSVPRIMGIINVTPDSFYPDSRCMKREGIKEKALQMLKEGADIIDIGACSTRPSSEPVSEEEEWERLGFALEAIRDVAPEAVISVDTFRSRIAYRSVTEYKADIINDISGSSIDPEITDVAAELKVPYVLTHIKGNPSNMTEHTDYEDVTAEVLTSLSKKAYELRDKLINDIIIDPGFGFAKTNRQNFRLLDELGEFCLMGMPVLAGISRKRMVYETLGVSPDEAYDGTLVLNTIAMERGADIVRVHDIKAAALSRKLLVELYRDKENEN